MPTFFNVWRLTVVYSYSKKMLESGDNHIKKNTRITCTESKSKLRRTLARHGEFWATKSNAMRYIGRVITTSVTSHFDEQLFSTLKHETTGKRVNTKVETVAHYLHQEHADDQRRARSRGRQFSNRTATAATLAVNASKFKFVESGSFFF